MIPGEMLRPAIIETIKKRDPSCAHSRMICVDCLDLFRSEYVEDALKDEVGELSKLEQEVVDSLREQENLTENINRAFERSITFGQHVADRVATFGGSWIFIGAFFLVLAAWIVINSVAIKLFCQFFDIGQDALRQLGAIEWNNHSLQRGHCPAGIFGVPSSDHQSRI